MSLFDSGWSALAAAGKTVKGVSITYRKLDGRSSEFTAYFGDSLRDQENDRNIVNVIKTDDVLIAVSDFETAFGTDERPQDGEVIETGDRRYRVRPLGTEPAVVTKSSVQFRVHLKDEGPL